MVVFMGMSLVIVLEAVPVLRRSRRHLQLFCCWLAAGSLLQASYGES